MVTAIFLTLALVFAAGLIIAALRRTLPLTIAAGLGWLAFAASGETGTGVVAALAALFMTAYALDELALAERWRPALIVAEAIAGMGAWQPRLRSPYSTPPMCGEAVFSSPSQPAPSLRLAPRSGFVAAFEPAKSLSTNSRNAREQ